MQSWAKHLEENIKIKQIWTGSENVHIKVPSPCAVCETTHVPAFFYNTSTSVLLVVNQTSIKRLRLQNILTRIVAKLIILGFITPTYFHKVKKVKNEFSKSSGLKQ